MDKGFQKPGFLTRSEVERRTPDLLSLIGQDGRNTKEKLVLAARRLGITQRRAKALYYGEGVTSAWEWDALLHLAERVERRMERVRGELNDLDREIAELRGQADRDDLRPLGGGRHASHPQKG